MTEVKEFFDLIGQRIFVYFARFVLFNGVINLLFWSRGSVFWVVAIAFNFVLKDLSAGRKETSRMLLTPGSELRLGHMFDLLTRR